MSTTLDNVGNTASKALEDAQMANRRVDGVKAVLTAEFGGNGSVGNTTRALRDICASVQGNGKPGIGMRLDRLEQVEKGRVWRERMIWASVVAAAISGIGSVLIFFLTHK